MIELTLYPAMPAINAATIPKAAPFTPRVSAIASRIVIQIMAIAAIIIVVYEPSVKNSLS